MKLRYVHPVEILAIVKKALDEAGVDLRTVRVVMNPAEVELLKLRLPAVHLYVTPGQPPPELDPYKLQLRADPAERDWRIERVP